MLTNIAAPTLFAEESQTPAPTSYFIDEEFAGFPTIIALSNHPLVIELPPHTANYLWLLSVLDLGPGDPGVKPAEGRPLSWRVGRRHLKTVARAMAEEFGFVNVFVEGRTEAVALTLFRCGAIV